MSSGENALIITDGKGVLYADIKSQTNTKDTFI